MFVESVYIIHLFSGIFDPETSNFAGFHILGYISFTFFGLPVANLIDCNIHLSSTFSGFLGVTGEFYEWPNLGLWQLRREEFC